MPRNPYATPSYYPQEPSSQFASPALFAKLDVDTLFYIFYYRPGTYLQYLAANELKKQSWRFHKQYLTWFQRANEPTTITDSYEQGVYLYFDWEGASPSWTLTSRFVTSSGVRSETDSLRDTQPGGANGGSTTFRSATPTSNNSLLAPLPSLVCLFPGCLLLLGPNSIPSCLSMCNAWFVLHLAGGQRAS